MGYGCEPERAAQQVVGLADVGHPIAHGFADGVFERGAAAGDALHLGAEHAHAEDIQALPPHVFFAHVDHAFEAQQRAHRGGGHAVLSGAGFGDDAALAHAAGEQRLSQAVIDLVRAGVQQVFALEPDARAAQGFGQVFGEVERRGAAGVVVQQAGKLGLKCRIVARLQIGGLEFFNRRHQDFGDVAPAVGSEVSAGIGLRSHARSAALAASRKSIIFMWSFIPGDDSMREQESTPQGWASEMARATLEASRPPARMMR